MASNTAVPLCTRIVDIGLNQPAEDFYCLRQLRHGRRWGRPKGFGRTDNTSCRGKIFGQHIKNAAC